MTRLRGEFPLVVSVMRLLPGQPPAALCGGSDSHPADDADQ